VARSLWPHIEWRRLSRIEVDPARIARRVRTGYCDRLAQTSMKRSTLRRRAGTEAAVSVGLVGNCAELPSRIAETRREGRRGPGSNHAHDPLKVTFRGLSLDGAVELRRIDPDAYMKRAMESMARPRERCWHWKTCGPVALEYGNNIRKMAFDAGVKRRV